MKRSTTTRTHLTRAGVAAAAVLLLAGCGNDGSSASAAEDTSADAASSSSAAGDDGSATGLTITDPWVKATDEGMTAAFGTFVNDTGADITVVGASSDVAGLVELHEVVAGDGGAMVMQPKEGGFTVPAGGTHELTAGGDHIMLMELTGPLEAGQDVTIDLELADGATETITAVVKPYTGADEEYAGGDHAEHGDDAGHDDHSDHDHGDAGDQ
ncbi:copper chaperone PCu(A)C [Nocardioides sp. ChNu-153]|uniref:copper chaperone PCu(A)C n=1 Tax=unclassified Nocardioides TaxID=2615069 RepID=UPI0024052C04|nr:MULTISPECIES: copper chaperone PCu(A)C [unclassified Nocardioides]MDF9716667.1 copper chaperone PCu(A)C [Nocardioides sp. ChNu-99]MDN7123044.1 copper chaperone PCu(A)C [Nocardioides sp. ChNu-153]